MKRHGAAVVAALFCLSLPLAARSDSPARVEIKDFAFGPVRITVERGGTVTWTNADKVGHSVVLAADSVRSGVLNTGQTFSKRFETVGTFGYVCGVHSYMTGQIEVQ